MTDDKQTKLNDEDDDEQPNYFAVLPSQIHEIKLKEYKQK